MKTSTSPTPIWSKLLLKDLASKAGGDALLIDSAEELRPTIGMQNAVSAARSGLDDHLQTHMLSEFGSPGTRSGANIFLTILILPTCV